MEITKIHKGHKISIGEETNMRFLVEGPLINTWFHDFGSAQTAIDDATKKNEAQARRRIAVKVYDEEGVECTITGIHAGTGAILGCENNAFYPAVPWVKDALTNLSHHLAEARRLRELTFPYKMNKYSIIKVRRRPHNETVDALLRLINDMTIAAEAADRAPPLTEAAG